MPASRRCVDCPRLIPRDSPRGRCAQCRRDMEKSRGSRQDRGYDATHGRLRRSHQERMDAGERFACWRCGQPIDPRAWTLGHCDDDRDRYHGPECPPCDYATRGRIACPHPSHGGGG